MSKQHSNQICKWFNTGITLKTFEPIQPETRRLVGKTNKQTNKQLWCYDRPQDVKTAMHNYFGKRIAQGYKNAQEQLDIKENMLFF